MSVSNFENFHNILLIFRENNIFVHTLCDSINSIIIELYKHVYLTESKLGPSFLPFYRI